MKKMVVMTMVLVLSLLFPGTAGQAQTDDPDLVINQLMMDHEASKAATPYQAMVVSHDPWIIQNAPNAYGSLQAAVNAAGDSPRVIYIQPGIYQENVQIVSRNANLILQGDTSMLTVVIGGFAHDGRTLDPNNPGQYAAGNAKIYIQDLNIVNYSGPMAIDIRGANSLTVVRCKIFAAQTAANSDTNDSAIVNKSTFIGDSTDSVGVKIAQHNDPDRANRKLVGGWVSKNTFDHMGTAIDASPSTHLVFWSGNSYNDVHANYIKTQAE